MRYPKYGIHQPLFVHLTPGIQSLRVQECLKQVHRKAKRNSRLTSHTLTSWARKRWQQSRVIFTACLYSLIHCSAVPLLLGKCTITRLAAVRLVTAKTTRGNNSPIRCSNLTFSILPTTSN